MFFLSLRKLFKKQKPKAQSSKSITTSDTKTTSSSNNQTSRDGINFKYEGGRRYQNEDKISYVLPNDYDELDRVHQQHWAFKYILQRNYFAPVEEQLKKGITVLDSGCGPATWTLDMAEEYPNSKFYGVDCSLVFPESIKPSNVELSICNVAQKIPFPDNTFDFIHQRLLILGLTDEDWNNNLKELYRVLKPGGYIELLEVNLNKLSSSGPLLSKMHEIMTEMLESRNLRPKILHELKDRLIKAGFIHQEFKITPLKINDNDMHGKLIWDDYTPGMHGMRPFMAQTNPEWLDEDIFSKYVEDCGEEAIKFKTRVNFGYHIVMKPKTM